MEVLWSRKIFEVFGGDREECRCVCVTVGKVLGSFRTLEVFWSLKKDEITDLNSKMTLESLSDIGYICNTRKQTSR
jgi:hypothetical protein